MLVSTVAAAGSPAPMVWSGETIPAPERGSVKVDERHVRLRNQATPSEVVVLSRANDNQTFTLWVVLPRQHENDSQYLSLGGHWWASEGTGFDATGTRTTFRLTRAEAFRVADAFGIPLHEREPLGSALTTSWLFPKEVPAKGPVPVVLRIENTGTAPVGFMVGGRQRGPRDNRFVFTATRDGAPVKAKEAPDFGGLGSYRKLAPGASLDVPCANLREWFDLEAPGTYSVEARYEGELSKDGLFPSTAAERAKLWDFVATGTGTLRVK